MKDQAIQEIRELMEKHRISMWEITGKVHPTKGIKIPAKYSDGQNSWSGRGLEPKWLKGKDKQQYLVKDAT